MFTPLVNSGFQRHKAKARTHFMLASGGRVVRVEDNDPCAVNRLMAPTASELKTILYDQTCARTTMRDNRESIDFVSLQANRRPRFRKDHGVIRKASELEHEAAADFPSLPIRPNPLRRRRPCNSTASEREDEWGEEDVSSFLSSFSASRMISADDEYDSTVDEPNTWQPSPLLQNGSISDGEMAADTKGTDMAQSMLAMSNPLAQVDLYRILARASPAKAECNGQDDVCPGVSGSVHGGVICDIMSKHRSSKKRERRSSSMEATTKVEVLVGGGGTDSIQDEIAELSAEVQEKSLRIKEEMGIEKKTAVVKAERHAARLAEKTRNWNAPKSTTSQKDPKILRAISSTVAGVHNSPLEFVEGFTSNEREGERSTPRQVGNTEEGVTPVTNTPASSSPVAESLVQLRTVCVTRRRRRRAPTETATEVKGKGVGLSKSTILPLKDVYGGSHGKPMRTERRHTVLNGDRRRGQNLKNIRAKTGYCWDKSSWSEPPQANRKDSCKRARVRENDSRTIQTKSLSDQGTFELKRNTVRPSETVPARAAGNAGTVPSDDDVAFRLRSETGHGVDVPHDARLEADASCGDYSPATAPVSPEAAAIRLQSCFRGFRDRHIARRAQRSSLLDSLRKIGGGKLFRVMALADLKEGDRQNLALAVRTATHSQHPRRGLPPQTQILDAKRFVELLWRRRTQAVETSKRRWVAEREMRRANVRENGPLGLSRRSSSAVLRSALK